MNYHSEKNRTKHDEDESELSIYTTENLLSFTSNSNINNISSEIKALQRSIAIMKQDFPKILRDELIRLKEGGL
jgi:hypothetical protein